MVRLIAREGVDQFALGGTAYSVEDGVVEVENEAHVRILVGHPHNFRVASTETLGARPNFDKMSKFQLWEWIRTQQEARLHIVKVDEMRQMAQDFYDRMREQEVEEEEKPPARGRQGK